jgi:hypothetical protein
MFNINYSIYDDKNNNNNIENTLLSIRKEQESRIGQSLHPAYNKFQEKLIEIIDGVLVNIRQFNNEDDVIDKIINELQREKDMVLYKKKKALDRIDTLKHRLEEECINYLLYIINDIKKDVIDKSTKSNSISYRIIDLFTHY